MPHITTESYARVHISCGDQSSCLCEGNLSVGLQVYTCIFVSRGVDVLLLMNDAESNTTLRVPQMSRVASCSVGSDKIIRKRVDVSIKIITQVSQHYLIRGY